MEVVCLILGPKLLEMFFIILVSLTGQSAVLQEVVSVTMSNIRYSNAYHSILESTAVLSM